MAAAPASTPIYDPRTTAVNNGVWTRTPFAGNIIPKAQWDPVATKFLSNKVWELPNLRRHSDGHRPHRQSPAPPPEDRRLGQLQPSRRPAASPTSSRCSTTGASTTRRSFTPDLNVVDLLYNSSQRISMDAQTTTGIGCDLHHHARR